MKVLITGSTGMIGKGVLLECLKNPEIDKVYLLNRSHIDIEHKKIEEIILSDFGDIESISGRLEHLDACFHCMGVSAAGMSKEKYSKLTFDVTKQLGDMCYSINNGMTFIYVSGTGTDSTEKGRTMWARVKGKAENYILGLGFKSALMFRPGMIIPEDGIRSRTKLYDNIYRVLRPLFPWLKKRKGITSTSRIGKAMIRAMKNPEGIPTYLENRQINAVAEDKED